MSNESNEILREVQASLKNEQIINFFKKNKKIIAISTSIICVVAIAIFYYNFVQKKRNQEFSTHIQKAITDQKAGKILESKDDLKKVFDDERSPQNLRAIAGFRLAAIYLSENQEQNLDKVIEIYRTINQCSSCDDFSKDLAGMLLVKFEITNYKNSDYDELIKRIKKVENSSKNYRYEIASDRAFFELERGNQEKAKEIFEFIANSPEAKDTIKANAKNGLRIINSRQKKS